MESIKRDLVTVIVPVFNTGTIVNRCVDSLIQQTYKEIEIIMIDDGSTDITSKILDQWSLSDNRIRIIHQKNTGVSGARNRGLKEANGKWIIFVDADDYVALDYVELMLQHMNNFTLPICDYFEVNENEKKVAMNLPSEWKNEKISQVFPVLYDKGFINTLWNKVFSKEIIDNNSIEFLENLALGEDLLFILDYLKYVENVAVVKKELYYYMRYESGSLRTKKYDDYDLLMMRLNKAVKKYTDSYCEQRFEIIYPVYHRLLSSTMNAYMEVFEENCHENIFIRSKKISQKMDKNIVLSGVLEQLKIHGGISSFQYMLIKKRHFLIYYYTKKIYLRAFGKSNSR